MYSVCTCIKCYRAKFHGSAYHKQRIVSMEICAYTASVFQAGNFGLCTSVLHVAWQSTLVNEASAEIWSLPCKWRMVIVRAEFGDLISRATNRAQQVSIRHVR